MCNNDFDDFDWVRELGLDEDDILDIRDMLDNDDTRRCFRRCFRRCLRRCIFCCRRCCG